MTPGVRGAPEPSCTNKNFCPYLVLPHYSPDETDEFGSKKDQMKKCDTSELEVLKNFETTVKI